MPILDFLFGGSSSSPGTTPKSADELAMEKRARELLDARSAILTGEGSIPSGGLTADLYGRMGYRSVTTGGKTEEDNPEYANIQKEISDLEFYSRSGGMSLDEKKQLPSKLSALNNRLAQTPKTITTDTTRTSYERVSEADRINPNSPYYDPD